MQNCKICNLMPNDTFLPELELPVIEPMSNALLPTTLAIKPNTQVKECHL